MSDRIIFEGPINALSLGATSLGLLKAAYKLGLKIDFLPIGGNLDFSAWKLDPDFQNWLINSANKFITTFDKKAVHIKNWHLNGSHSWVGSKRISLTYLETDSLTESEINIIKNIDKTFFCGEYSYNVAQDYGLENIDWFKLGFDSETFYDLKQKFHDDGRVSWHLGGKIENRKNQIKLINLWVKKFGREPGQVWKEDNKHFLNVAITNPFYNTQELQNHFNQQINSALEGRRYWNVQFHPWLQTNAEVNQLLNVSDIDLTGLSSGESWNLPSFNSTCLGKWSIVLNSTGHKSWANKDNSILVNPNGKRSAVDNIFFHQNSQFSVGNFYTFKDEDVLEAMDKAAQLAKTPNTHGIELGKQMTYENSLKEILSKI